jgi:hypothetical protein
MSDWTKEKLESMIADGIEESLGVEYKAAGALAKDDDKKREITKDVSAFANSAGGVLIYGIAEHTDKARQHLPECLDPVSRREISKEWLEQIVQQIQPRVEGVAIYPVAIDAQNEKVCYVVEIPRSSTAHQARDLRYYKRHNFNALPMEDYEVRDVMNRRTHPALRLSLWFDCPRIVGRGNIRVKLENIGLVSARHVMVELEFPPQWTNSVFADPDQVGERLPGDDGEFHRIRLKPEVVDLPIFPGSDAVFGRVVDMKEPKSERTGPNVPSRHVRATVFADEMRPMRGRLGIEQVLFGWKYVPDERALGNAPSFSTGRPGAV